VSGHRPPRPYPHAVASATSRLFQVVEPVDANTERIGVDFEFCTDGDFPFAVKFWECAAACEGGQCAAGECKAKACCAEGQCPATAACECPGEKACQACQVATKAGCACGMKCACDTKCACGMACQCSGDVVRHYLRTSSPDGALPPGHPVPVAVHHFAPPPIVSYGAPHPGGCPAMFEHLLTLTAKSAALEAKLEARTEQAELVEQMLELAGENARLKAQVELAEAKAEMQQQVLQVALENEQLKSKLAELTSKLESEHARTARPQVGNAPR
jgi:hypothetical protein